MSTDGCWLPSPPGPLSQFWERGDVREKAACELPAAAWRGACSAERFVPHVMYRKHPPFVSVPAVCFHGICANSCSQLGEAKVWRPGVGGADGMEEMDGSGRSLGIRESQLSTLNAQRSTRVDTRV